MSTLQNLISFLLLLPFFMSGKSTLLMSRPDVYDDELVFEYGGDLWISKIQEKVAYRLTSYEGGETNPEFSPDGKFIAYSGQYNADNYDVYIIPETGAEPKRLTYHPADDWVIGWTPDGKYILFVSARRDWKLRRLYKVSPDGGLPEEIPLSSVYEADFSLDGTKVVFNRGPARLEWKGYRGGRTPAIWLWDQKRDTTYKLIDWEGTEIYPQWFNGKIYFLADKDGRLNIYSYDPTTKETKRITEHKDFDIRSINKGNSKIVYACGGGIYLLNPNTEVIDTISIYVPDDYRFLTPHYEAVADIIESYNLSPSGKRAVFCARGEVFTVPQKKGPVINITKTSGIRERDPIWSPDANWIAFLSDKTGENEIYIKKSDGTGKEISITNNADCFRYQPIWSPDSKKLLYTDSKYRLFYVDIENPKPVLIDTSSMSRFSSLSWSPDSRWIAYIKLNENWFGSIYLYSLNDRSHHKITTEFFDDREVCFEPSGKYLYFISSRTFNPIYDNLSELKIYPRTNNICLMTLQQDEPSPFLPESDEEKTEAKEEEKKVEELKIDLENIERRVVTVPVSAGNYRGLNAAEKKVLYLERTKSEVRKRKYNLHCYNLKDREDNILIKDIDGYTLSSDGKYFLYKSGDTYGIVDAEKKGVEVGEGKLKTGNMEMRIDRKSEISQMFDDAWRLQRDFYYDPKMHGLDWNYQREKFGEFLPYIADRDDLTRIISWLFSELGGSHAYVWSSKDRRKKVGVGLLGAEFELDKKSGCYRFKKILRGESWKENRRAPLTEPGTVVNEGEYLISVGNKIVREPDNPYKFFENTTGKQISITVNSRPDATGAREIKIMPISLGNERELYYLDWVEKNRKEVEAATDGRVGYIHVPNTSVWGLEEFGKYFFSQAGKEGLIIDVRYNGGGWSPDMFMDYLQRRPLGCFIRRQGRSEIEPFVKFQNRLVCIINEYAGSGGDMFPYYFRELGLGPLIGKTTWGGLIATTGRGLMDGGGITTPVQRFKDISGRWRIENEGVKPDIFVDDHPDALRKGIDQQLQKAIEVIKKKLRE